MTVEEFLKIKTPTWVRTDPKEYSGPKYTYLDNIMRVTDPEAPDLSSAFMGFSEVCFNSIGVIIDEEEVDYHFDFDSTVSNNTFPTKEIKTVKVEMPPSRLLREIIRETF